MRKLRAVTRGSGANAFDGANQLVSSTTDGVTTQYAYDAAGLGHAFLFRNYRAGLAKWQTADPLGYPDGWNQLTYCGNSITDCVDCMGLCDNPLCKCDDCQCKVKVYPNLLNHDDNYFVGRDDVLVINTKNDLMNFIEDYFSKHAYIWCDS